MLTTIVTSVVAALIVAGILGAARWLRRGPNRDQTADFARRALCRHDWEPVNTGGDGILLVTTDREECHKCGKRR